MPFIKQPIRTLILSALLLSFLPISTAVSQLSVTAGMPPAWIMTRIVQVDRVMAAENGAVYVRSTSDIVNPAGCNATYWYVLNVASEEANSKMLATVMTAKASEIGVRFGISKTECVFNSPKIVAIMLD